MSVVHAQVRSALRQQLALLPSIPEVSYENRPFSPVEDTSYLRETFRPQTSPLETLGPNGRIRHYGLYLIDCFCPAQVGTLESDALAGGLLTLFPPGKVLTYSGQVVTIQESSRAGGRNEPGWLMVPVTISWYTDTYNSI